MFLLGLECLQGSMRWGGSDLVGCGLGDKGLALVAEGVGMKHGLVGWSPIAVLGSVFCFARGSWEVDDCVVSLCFFLSGGGFVL